MVRNPPYNTILKATSEFKTKTLVSTAVLVGPNHALISYFNIQKKEIKDAINVQVSSHLGKKTATMKDKFTFGFNEDIVGLLYYKNTDTALLILDKPIGNELGYMPMYAISTEEHFETDIFLAGLVLNKRNSVQLISNQGKCIKHERNIKEEILIYDMPTFELETIGCPIYIEDEKDKKTESHSYSIIQRIESHSIGQRKNRGNH